MPIRLLGIQIANGYSPEARVFASLLGYRANAYDAHVLHHAWSGDQQSPISFGKVAAASISLFNTGWRPNPGGRRSLPAKAASQIQFRLALPRMLQAARAYNPDVIYSCQQHWDCLAATYIARRLGKPQIIHLHYTVGAWLHKPILERLLTTDHIITVSDFIRQEALNHGVPPERVTTIRNTMTPFAPPVPGTREAVRAELGIPPNAPVIGIIARLDPGKGQDDTIAAFTKIAPNFSDARLVIVGDGTQRATLEAHAAETGFTDRIIFTGHRTDVPRLLAAFDIFAHPSRMDPCPLALLEATAAGLPTVAYAEGGACEIVAHGETGLLALPGDVPSLAIHIGQLVGDLRKAKDMGMFGKQHLATHFRPEAAKHDFERLLYAIPGY